MAHFKSYFFVKASLICSLVILQSLSETETVRGNLPEVSKVLKFLENMISPYLKSVRSNSDQARTFFRTKRDVLVEKVIRDKVAELKLYLQDNELKLKEPDDNGNLTLEGKDETTIIEFIPETKLKDKVSLRDTIDQKKDSLKANVDEYKRIRNQIQSALIRERVSHSTSSLITNTLDDMIAMVLENQCSWKSSKNYDNKHTQYRVDRSVAMTNEWNEQWASLKDQYVKFIKENPSDTFPGAKLFVFFEQFHDFLSHIAKDVQSISGQYKIVCQMVEHQKPAELRRPQKDLREGDSKTSVVKKKHKCDHFKVCTDELTKFMIDFYYALNDTAVSTLRNYGSMYIRDVITDDSQEKESVVTVLNNIGDLSEYKISKIFRKEINYFQLDKDKDEDDNVKLLKIFVKNTIGNAKNYIKGSLETGLQSLRARLSTTVKQDLNVNLDMDLGNLERDFKSRICTVFSICNGQYAGRRNYKDGKQQDRNSIYVKVQLSLDDELKEKLSGPKYEFIDFEKVKTTNGFKKNQHWESWEFMNKLKNKLYRKPDFKSGEHDTRIKKKTTREDIYDSDEYLRENEKHIGRYRGTKAFRKIFKTSFSTYKIPSVTRTTHSPTFKTVTTNTKTTINTKATTTEPKKTTILLNTTTKVTSVLTNSTGTVK